MRDRTGSDAYLIVMRNRRAT